MNTLKKSPAAALLLTFALVLLLWIVWKILIPPPDPRPPEPNSIGDFVFGDFSGTEDPCDGSQVGNSGNGLSGVTMELWRPGDSSPYRTDTTSDEEGYVGRYRFYDVQNSVTPYTVKVIASTLPSSVDGTSKPTSQSATMSGGATINNKDFGFCAP
jgi:hypothetical protein